MGMFKDFPFGSPESVALAPIDLAGGAKTTLWANARDVNDFLCLWFYLAPGTATQDITITLQQATTAAGGSAKALRVFEVFFKRGAPTFTAANAAVQDRFVRSPSVNREASTATYVTTVDRVATTNHFIGCIRISPKDLDGANGFRYVGASFSSPAAAQLGMALWMPIGLAGSGIGAQSLLT